MNNPYENLLVSPNASSDQNCPTESLCQKVMQKIESREISHDRRFIYGFGLVVITAIVAFIPAINYLIGTTSSSGLGQYVSLLVSDGSYALSHWQELFMSITDALPVTAIMAIVALLLVCLSSLRQFMSYQQSLSIHERHRAIRTV